MKADKKDKFKYLLKLAADEKPAAGFTASIMQTIEVDVQRETALKTILQKEDAAGPSFSFTANVMAGIQASKPTFVYKPIISTKGWWGIAAAFLFMISLSLFSSPQHTMPGKNGFTALVSYTYAIPPVYAIVMLAATALLVVDYLVSRLKTKTSERLA